MSAPDKARALANAIQKVRDMETEKARLLSQWHDWIADAREEVYKLSDDIRAGQGSLFDRPGQNVSQPNDPAEIEACNIASQAGLRPRSPVPGAQVHTQAQTMERLTSCRWCAPAGTRPDLTSVKPPAKFRKLCPGKPTPGDQCHGTANNCNCDGCISGDTTIGDDP